MKPFLILQLRDNDLVADDEFQAMKKYGGLRDDEVVRIRMEQGNLPTINVTDYSGILVGGGSWNVSDKEEEKSDLQKAAEIWLANILKEIIAKDVPYLGACYGLGMLNRSQSAPVSKEKYNEAVGAVTIELTEEGKQDSLLQGLGETFRAFVGHKEACQALPEGAVHLAKSSTCPIQMYRMGKNVYACQFHPELDVEGICKRTDVYKYAGYFPPEEAEEIKERARKEELSIPMEILHRFVERARS